eukprot:246610_1
MSQFNSLKKTRYGLCILITFICVIVFFLREELLIINILQDKELFLENNINSIELSDTIEIDNNETIVDIDNTNINSNVDDHMYEYNEMNNNNAQNIYFDNESYNELIEYSSYINRKTFPSNWLELNDQLFCPIKYSQ